MQAAGPPSLPTCLEESRCVSPERADRTEQGDGGRPKSGRTEGPVGILGAGGDQSYTTTTLSPAGGKLAATQCTILTITFDWLSITPVQGISETSPNKSTLTEHFYHCICRGDGRVTREGGGKINFMMRRVEPDWRAGVWIYSTEEISSWR